jgi:NTE family protein
MRPLAVVQAPAPDADVAPEPQPEPPKSAGWMQRLTPWRADAPAAPVPQQVPSVLDVMMTSVNIMQMRITRSRMAGDPPEVVVAPALANLGLLDFHRASEAIEEGRRAAKASMSQLRRFMG